MSRSTEKEPLLVRNEGSSQYGDSLNITTTTIPAVPGPSPPPYTQHITEDRSDVDVVVERVQQQQQETHKPPTPDPTSLDTSKIKVYTRRFWILFVFAMIAWFQCLQWNTWGPLSDSVNAAFPGRWGSKTVAMMANWGTITFVLFVSPMCWLMTAKGLRVGVMVCAALIAIGTVARAIPLIFTTSDVFFTVMAHICAICVGIPGTLIMAAPPLIAAEWFPPKERTTATAVSQVLNQLGNAGSYLEPLIVRAPLPSITPGEIKEDITRLMNIWAGVGLTLFLAVVVYFPSKPPTPPSPTAHIDRLDFRDSVGKIMRNRDLLLVTISYGVCNGVPSAWASVLNYSLLDLGLQQEDAMWVGLTGVLVSGTVGLLVGRLTDLVYGYVKFTLILFMIGNMACFYWFFLLSWGTIPATLWQIYASVVGGMSFNFACSPLFFELAVEISYPCSEVIVGGLVTGMNNLVGLSFLFIFFIPNIGYAWVTYVLVGASAVSILPVLFVKEDYYRSSIDRHNLHHSAYQPI
ncbi:hypothetical protein Pmani_023987 [Petrolisthes manimaculis]|uniref:Uncharacterized protein n=1 Tax=Petrolisthes manimaculis TaxID=1843537 RepID=A0AAE1TZ52_9EUCA|nr:hypothetical protein Pmani_023987 [Petrolisthes manimaculis]